jgi:Tol biopolymer transport system component
MIRGLTRRRWQGALVATAALLASAVSAVVVPQPAQAQLGRYFAIGFTRPVGGVHQIFTVTLYGGDVTQITHEAMPITDPTWSPDGSMIAFVEVTPYGEALFAANADGSSVTPLFFPPGSFAGIAWSPDGVTLAMGYDPGSGIHIWTAHLDGSRRVQVTSGTGSESHPTWSPDGTQLAFARSAGGRSHIFVMKADGSALTQITRGKVSDTSPAWSPDGSMIAFSSNRGGGRHLFVVAPDGTALTQITQDAGADAAPSWSPWNDQLDFTRRLAGHPPTAAVMVWIRWNGQIVQLTDGSANDRTAAWQPPDSYEVSLDGAAKQDGLQALSLARQYWALYGTYTGLDWAWMQQQDPDGEYVDHGTGSDGSNVSVSGTGTTFFAGRLSATGECFGLEDVGGTLTSFGVMPQSLCSADTVQYQMPLDPAWPRG